MKSSELKALPDGELTEKLQGLREEIFNLRFKATTEPIDNPGLVREMRKDIARALTVLRERELAGKPRAKKTTREERRRAGEERAKKSALATLAKARIKPAKKMKAGAAKLTKRGKAS